MLGPTASCSGPAALGPASSCSGPASSCSGPASPGPASPGPRQGVVCGFGSGTDSSARGCLRFESSEDGLHIAFYFALGLGASHIHDAIVVVERWHIVVFAVGIQVFFHQGAGFAVRVGGNIRNILRLCVSK